MAVIELITSPACPHCLPVKKALAEAVQKIKGEGLKVTLTNYSTATPQGAAKAREYGVASVPTAIVAGSKQSFVLDAFNVNTVREACLVADGKKEMPKKKGLLERLFGNG